jgi:hypothetical protein
MKRNDKIIDADEVQYQKALEYRKQAKAHSKPIIEA